MDNSNKSILIVDDNEVDLRVLGGILQKSGFKQIRAEMSGETAYSTCVRLLEDDPENQHRIFDLVISDWNMPNGSGLLLLKRLKENMYFRDIPFIMMTGRSDPEEIKTAIGMGVQDYIVKPPQAEVVQKKVEQALTKNSEAQEAHSS